MLKYDTLDIRKKTCYNKLTECKDLICDERTLLWLRLYLLLLKKSVIRSIFLR
jgi:hypothetical protein